MRRRSTGFDIRHIYVDTEACEYTHPDAATLISCHNYQLLAE